MPAAPSQPARQRGVTLLELVLAASVLLLLAGIALPGLHGFAEHQRARAAMHGLLAEIGHARIAAIRHNRRSVLCPSLDGRSCSDGREWQHGRLLFVDLDGNRRPDPGDPVLQANLAPIGRGLRIVTSRGRDQLRFLPDGRSAGSNLALAVCDGRGRLLARVVVNNLGRARGERIDADLPCPG